MQISISETWRHWQQLASGDSAGCCSWNMARMTQWKCLPSSRWRKCTYWRQSRRSTFLTNAGYCSTVSSLSLGWEMRLFHALFERRAKSNFVAIHSGSTHDKRYDLYPPRSNYVLPPLLPFFAFLFHFHNVKCHLHLFVVFIARTETQSSFICCWRHA